MSRLELHAPGGFGEVRPGDDLVAMVARLDLADGDVVLLTSKVVSKAEGRAVRATREDVLAADTVRVVARRGPLTIVENHLGLVMAAAGIDASNVEPGTVLFLPADPDGTARTIREGVYAGTGRNVAVLVTDTAGRAWRLGQTDIAIGAAGIEPLESLAGQEDRYGNPLAVTEPAVADELAAAAELVSGKLSGRPVTVVRGLAARVLPPGSHGAGARSVVRKREEDLFALGAREAVVAAVAGDDPLSFGAPAEPEELIRALERCGIAATWIASWIEVKEVDDADRARVVAHAHRWGPVGESATLLGPLP